MKNYLLVLEGIKWGGCTSKIERVLSELPEVSNFSVSLEEKTVSAQGENLKGKLLKTAIEKLGFSVVSLKKTKL